MVLFVDSIIISLFIIEYSTGRISNLSLESEIIQAVEQVLLHRGGAQGGGFGHAYGGGK